MVHSIALLHYFGARGEMWASRAPCWYLSAHLLLSCREIKHFDSFDHEVLLKVLLVTVLGVNCAGEPKETTAL